MYVMFLAHQPGEVRGRISVKTTAGARAGIEHQFKAYRFRGQGMLSSYNGESNGKDNEQRNGNWGNIGISGIKFHLNYYVGGTPLITLYIYIYPLWLLNFSSLTATQFQSESLLLSILPTHG